MKNDIAKLLLDIEAVKFSVEKPFQYASGNVGPIYTDCRLLMSYPKERRIVAEELAAMIKKQVGLKNVDVLAGTASAGIPHAAWVSDILKKPMIYVRKKSKDHGLGQTIEGIMPKDKNVIVIEDLVNTGESSVNNIKSLRDHGAKVDHCICIFTYGLRDSIELFSQLDVELHSLTNFEIMLEKAMNSGYVSKEEALRAQDWKENPRWW